MNNYLIAYYKDATAMIYRTKVYAESGQEAIEKVCKFGVRADNIVAVSLLDECSNKRAIAKSLLGVLSDEYYPSDEEVATAIRTLQLYCGHQKCCTYCPWMEYCNEAIGYVKGLVQFSDPFDYFNKIKENKNG